MTAEPAIAADGPRVPAAGPGERGLVVISGVASDAHTWNLVYVQLLIEELGYRVVNLGPCVPPEMLVAECERLAPDLVVVSSVNGHGHQDGLALIEAVRARPELAATPVVIGGKLGVTGEDGGAPAAELAAAGYDGVFADGATALFGDFLRALPVGARPDRVLR